MNVRLDRQTDVAEPWAAPYERYRTLLRPLNVVSGGHYAAIAGVAIVALAYLAADESFDLWWPGFMIPALGGTAFFVLLMVGFLLAEMTARLDRACAGKLTRTDDLAFKAIVEGTAGSTGEDFFRSLVEHLATALGVDHAFVAEVTDGRPARAATTAFWSRGRIVPNVEYELAGTPCAHVVAGELCFHPARVQSAFPVDRNLAALGAESYLGMPLSDSSGERFGLVVVLDKRPMRDNPRHQEILKVFAARAGAELERQRSERALRNLNSALETRVRERTAQLQAALDESSRLATVLEATPDIVGVASLDGQVRYLNRAGRLRLGVRLDERVERYHISTFYTGVSFERITGEGIPAAIHEGSWSGELVMRSLEGEEIPVSMAGIVHFDATGAPAFISAIARDISSSKRIEAELESAKEAAEAASRSKSTFLATMSHEIRTPMNAVIGMTDLLLATSLTAKQREFVETIRAGGDALLTVINDILDFSKIEAGRLELEHRVFNLRQAIESTVDLLAPRAAEKGLELALSIAPGVPASVAGDEIRMRQILVNLVGNGIKFTDSGEVVVSVASSPGAAEGPQIELVLSVRDTGIGIPQAKRDRLFASFSQLDPSTTREFGGTGLGLAISKRLVELMGGTIWVESDGVPGRGSNFQFTLRLERASAPADDPIPPRDAQSFVAGRRVLVVDDNATNRHILDLQLQAWGMSAVQAASPAEASELLRRGDHFDLVILDMQMPGMDGLMLAKAISEEHARRLPIILLTSVGRDLGGEADCLACLSGVLTKPVKSSQLYDAIMTAVAGRDARLEDSAADRMPVAPAVRPVPACLDILLAEDIEVNRKFALLALEELGCCAKVAVNGAEVIRELRRVSYDVILMDVQMPGIDGLEATRLIRRELPAHRQPYIIAMTANAMRGDREMCLEAGMDDYLSKPVYLEELRTALERAARHIAARRANPAGASTAGRASPTEPAPGDAADGPAEHRQRGQSSGAALIELFVTEADIIFRRLREAAERGDVDALREAAHALKGASAYVGAARVVTLSGQIERAANVERTVDRSAVEGLEAELGRVREEHPPIATPAGAHSSGKDNRG